MVKLTLEVLRMMMMMMIVIMLKIFIHKDIYTCPFILTTWSKFSFM